MKNGIYKSLKTSDKLKYTIIRLYWAIILIFIIFSGLIYVFTVTQSGETAQETLTNIFKAIIGVYVILQVQNMITRQIHITDERWQRKLQKSKKRYYKHDNQQIKT